MIRATTGGVMKTYRSNLMNSFINMNANRNTVLSQRTFNSFAEDPAAAAKAFRLRKSRMMVDSQHSICTDVLMKYQTGVACLQSIDDVLCTKDGEYGQYMRTLTGTTLTWLNDTTGDAREQLTVALDQMSQQIIQTMNQKYGDNFIFAGADGHNVPFEIKGDGKLYYRGVPVDAAMPNVLMQTGADGTKTPVIVSETGEIVDPATLNDGDPVQYLNMDNADIITVEKYNKLYVLPDLADGEPHAEYNKDGTPYDPDLHPEDGGPYYLLQDPDENGLPQYIAKSEYEAIEARQADLPQRLMDTDGVTPYTYTDENGEECYIIFDADKDPLMDKSAYEQQKTDYEKLQYLARETNFVDIGFGFQEDPVTGKLIESSAFNSALNGINFIGYGLDEDGDPKNLYSLVQRMKKISDSVGENESWDGVWDEFNRLVGKFEKAVSNYQTEFVNLDASTGKLSGQEELLVKNFDNLQEQYSDIEDVDMVDAITSFIWAEYCYNAALKVGNSILSESLMDYLR